MKPAIEKKRRRAIVEKPCLSNACDAKFVLESHHEQTGMVLLKDDLLHALREERLDYAVGSRREHEREGGLLRRYTHDILHRVNRWVASCAGR